MFQEALALLCNTCVRNGTLANPASNRNGQFDEINVIIGVQRECSSSTGIKFVLNLSHSV